ncbi:hypothetical protein HF1_11550 [Mycoplasma haemofelis str. Langford 1]|uniref:Uncharacterized protein n=1 Tax=Mycoplasma haemofelis (strain Langford 1) TaxID=941640 RepID=E8ZJ42_MYCHL|nr:hypothetical protein [Mycoplasma haemofelis]CBY93163.1 hypothetical protein HF1_11550 [Mycoplasma haemofelis str. Langford 1]
MKLGTVAASLGGASAASVAAAGGYHYLSSKNAIVSIKESLKGSRLISDLPSSSLTKQWQEEFKSAKEDISRDIEDLKGVTEEVDGGKKLESWCSRQMDLDSAKNADVLALVKKYCLVRSVSSQLSRNKKTLLGSGDEEKSKWQATYKKREERKTDRKDMGLQDAWNGKQEDKDLPKIKEWCSNHQDNDFIATEDLYTKLLKWCTVEGATEE